MDTNTGKAIKQVFSAQGQAAAEKKSRTSLESLNPVLATYKGFLRR